jgi:hypothetical protein
MAQHFVAWSKGFGQLLALGANQEMCFHGHIVRRTCGKWSACQNSKYVVAVHDPSLSTTDRNWAMIHCAQLAAQDQTNSIEVILIKKRRSRKRRWVAADFDAIRLNRCRAINPEKPTQNVASSQIQQPGPIQCRSTQVRKNKGPSTVGPCTF